MNVRIEFEELRSSTKNPFRVTPIINDTCSGIAITLNETDLANSKKEFTVVITEAYRQGHRTGFLEAQKLMKEALGFYD